MEVMAGDTYFLCLGGKSQSHISIQKCVSVCVCVCVGDTFGWCVGVVTVGCVNMVCFCMWCDSVCGVCMV